MKRIVPAAMILLWLSPCAWSQTITTDTVVVAKAYEGKVIIATDSRVLDNVSGNYKDDDCKIAELGGKFVFASALTRSINLKVNKEKLRVFLVAIKVPFVSPFPQKSENREE